MVTGRDSLTAARRLVVKIGSNALCHPSGELNLGVLESLAEEIAGLMSAGRQCVIITSGAVKIGLYRMGVTHARDLPTRQAAAAVGQSDLICAYERAFARHERPVAQILLTQNELSDFRRYLHLRNVLDALLARHGAVPVLNENDPVSAQGVEIGENDRLAALIASKIDADLLVLLSNVDGLYPEDPSRGAKVAMIPEVEKITPELLAAAAEADDSGGKGGMKAKLDAVGIATRAGVAVVITSSRTPRVLSRLVAGEQIGTLFHHSHARLRSKKHWIGFARFPKGKLTVDEGACKALLEKGSSLLPVGVANVEGSFNAGDTVSVVDFTGKEIARGLINYNADDMRLIRRCKTKEVAAKLGRLNYDEAINRTNLVLI